MKGPDGRTGPAHALLTPSCCSVDCRVITHLMETLNFSFLLPIFQETSFIYIRLCLCVMSQQLCSCSNMMRWIALAHTHTHTLTHTHTHIYRQCSEGWRCWRRSCCSGIWTVSLPAGTDEEFAFSLLLVHRATVQSNVPPRGS